ncbi:molybdenum cofactor guanylyltransferase [Sphingomonas silueang]|uniref:molybdenum cofactor guanylyltransferase n=1 Tax=Sphingomonas silueang TaxID=3156617 RepID=UPI0032B5A02F
MRRLGAILAGGRSSRFGSDKALALLHGRALIDRVADALRPQVDALVVVGRDHPGLTGTPDRPAADLGPLGGIAGALAHAAAHGFSHVLSVPCDAPDLPDDLPALLGEPPACLADLPVVGLWPSAALAELDALLAGPGSRSVRAFADRIGARAVPGGGIANVNTADDLARIAAAERR